MSSSPADIAGSFDPIELDPTMITEEPRKKKVRAKKSKPTFADCWQYFYGNEIAADSPLEGGNVEYFVSFCVYHGDDSSKYEEGMIYYMDRLNSKPWTNLSDPRYEIVRQKYMEFSVNAMDEGTSQYEDVRKTIKAVEKSVATRTKKRSERQSRGSYTALLNRTSPDLNALDLDLYSLVILLMPVSTFTKYAKAVGIKNPSTKRVHIVKNWKEYLERFVEVDNLDGYNYIGTRVKRVQSSENVPQRKTLLKYLTHNELAWLATKLHPGIVLARNAGANEPSTNWNQVLIDAIEDDERRREITSYLSYLHNYTRLQLITLLTVYTPSDDFRRALRTEFYPGVTLDQLLTNLYVASRMRKVPARDYTNAQIVYEATKRSWTKFLSSLWKSDANKLDRYTAGCMLLENDIENCISWNQVYGNPAYYAVGKNIRTPFMKLYNRARAKLMQGLPVDNIEELKVLPPKLAQQLQLAGPDRLNIFNITDTGRGKSLQMITKRELNKEIKTPAFVDSALNNKYSEDKYSVEYVGRNVYNPTSKSWTVKTTRGGKPEKKMVLVQQSDAKLSPSVDSKVQKSVYPPTGEEVDELGVQLLTLIVDYIATGNEDLKDQIKEAMDDYMENFPPSRLKDVCKAVVSNVRRRSEELNLDENMERFKTVLQILKCRSQVVTFKRLPPTPIQRPPVRSPPRPPSTDVQMVEAQKSEIANELEELVNEFVGTMWMANIDVDNEWKAFQTEVDERGFDIEKITGILCNTIRERIDGLSSTQKRNLIVNMKEWKKCKQQEEEDIINQVCRLYNSTLRKVGNYESVINSDGHALIVDQLAKDRVLCGQLKVLLTRDGAIDEDGFKLFLTCAERLIPAPFNNGRMKTAWINGWKQILARLVVRECPTSVRHSRKSLKRGVSSKRKRPTSDEVSRGEERPAKRRR